MQVVHDLWKEKLKVQKMLTYWRWIWGNAQQLSGRISAPLKLSTSQKETKETSSSHTNLLSKPFVQLLAAVKHKTFSLGSFLALSHQSGVLISLKQSWNLTTTKHALNFCCCWRRNQRMLNAGRQRLANKLKLWATNSETEKKKNKVE